MLAIKLGVKKNLFLLLDRCSFGTFARVLNGQTVALDALVLFSQPTEVAVCSLQERATEKGAGQWTATELHWTASDKCNVSKSRCLEHTD